MGVQMHPDQEIINAFSKGDEKAFRQVFNFYYKSIYYFSRNLISSKEDAEDITLNTFQKLFERHIHFNQGANIRSFLFVIARNSCLNYLRDNKQLSERQKEFAAKMKDDVLLLYENEIKDELIERVRKAINDLPHDCRKIFKMLYYEELTPTEVAEILQISVNTVYVQKSRALQALRIALKDQPLLLAWLLFAGRFIHESLYH